MHIIKCIVAIRMHKCMKKSFVWELGKMYHIVICDAQIEFIVYIEKLLESCVPKSELTFLEYHSGEEMIEDIKKGKSCDLLILDMQLKEMDGYHTAKVFRELFPGALLVFCSMLQQPPLESFEVLPCRYLLKTYTEERMREELEIVLEQMRRNISPVYIIGKRDNSYIKVDIENVLYIELARRKTLLYCKVNQREEIYTSARKLEEWYEQLREFGFVYAHNSYIVNLRHVIMVGTEVLKLDTGEQLSVARSKMKGLRQAFLDESENVT